MKNNLNQASWLIAVSEHQGSINYDSRLHLDKPTTYDDIKNRAKLMYTGIYAPRDPSIEKLISSFFIKFRGIIE